MRLNVTQKILIGYVAGFILLLAFTALTLFNGKKIEATTVTLSQEKIPGLIAVSNLRSDLQTQTIQLYELYATNNQTLFEKNHHHSMLAMQQDVAKLGALAEFRTYEAPLAVMTAKQTELTNQFVQIMRQSDIDWDAARSTLSAFSDSAKQTDSQLNQLVKTVSEQTLAKADASQKLTEQLITAGFVLAFLTFLGVVGMAYYSNRQVALPLRAVSVALGDITARRDFTYRLKQHTHDEVGDIAISANLLLDEFQRLARTLDGTTQEVNRTMNNLTEITENTRVSMVDRNAKLRNAIFFQKLGLTDFMPNSSYKNSNNEAEQPPPIPNQITYS